ncbi:SMI1/KNR4 family protein [Formosa sp. PL04]|uniref:SMI1/KNR4 family protein n=1 Tax=Formosa sp. PL04 TaxID=3081755 RepID=UPI002980D784|nr:SMI1/KNR4 family protein [Formosa sp. PL04]MDW5290713.1 SMI1/KNR4 family protein [Formosa sp. PL04]
MGIKKIEYNNQLKKNNITDIPFNNILLQGIPEPYFQDYSHHKSETARSHKSYDTMGFRDVLLSQLSETLQSQVLKLILITPKEGKLSYDGYAYLSNKHIVAMHFEDSGHFKQWMDIIFKRQFEKLKEYKENGQFDSQPELNPNPQFMLILEKGQFSQKWVNSGMMIDERPYENTGIYLHKNAPKQYNETKISKEKQNYLKKHIDTNSENIDSVQLQKLFNEFINTKHFKPNPPRDNEKIYDEFESLANYKFPKALKIVLDTHNGIENTGFLSAEEILNEWKNWNAIFNDPNWMLTDLTGNNLPDGKKTIGIYTNPYWIPFWSTGGGNFIAVDYLPGSKGNSGQIIAFGADETKIRFIAKNMEDFLEQLIEGKDVLNNGFEK